MMLFIDGSNTGIRHENVGYYIQDYESAFDRLTQLVADDWSLESAIVVDNGDCTALPVEAFDGQSILIPIRALQQQWNELLEARPAQRAALCPQKDRYLQLDAYYEGLLTRIKKVMFRRLSRLNSLRSSPRGPLQSQLIVQHQQLLENSLRLYKHTAEHQQRNLQRLQALKV